MKRTALAILMAISAIPISAQERSDRPRGRPVRHVANPSAVVATEIARSRLAQEKGEAAALLETAAPTAELFTPLRVLAAERLKARVNPPVAARRQVHAVWMSCDGTSAVAQGARQASDGDASYLTVWQRQPKRGELKWTLDDTRRDAAAPAEPEMIAAKIAECSGKPGPVPASPPPQGVDAREGRSPDMTLQWSSWVYPDGRRLITAWVWNGSGFDAVVNVSTAPPAERG